MFNRIKLRLLALDDTKTIICWRNQPFVRNNMIDQRELDEKTHINWYHKIESKDVIQFIVLDENDIEFATVFLKDINIKYRKAEIGIFIGKKEYLNKGYGKEIISEIIKYGFEELNLNRMYSRVLSFNIGSISLFERMNFVRDGIMRESVIVDNTSYDIHIFSMLRKEYYKSKQL